LTNTNSALKRTNAEINMVTDMEKMAVTPLSDTQGRQACRKGLTFTCQSFFIPDTLAH